MICYLTPIQLACSRFSQTCLWSAACNFPSTLCFIPTVSQNWLTTSGYSVVKDGMCKRTFSLWEHSSHKPLLTCCLNNCRLFRFQIAFFFLICIRIYLSQADDNYWEARSQMLSQIVLGMMLNPDIQYIFGLMKELWFYCCCFYFNSLTE